MKVNSIRFGELDIPENKVIFMEKPILGFDNYRKYCLIEIDELLPVLWLQCIDDPNVVLPIVNPKAFSPDYKIEINSKEIAELKVKDVNDVEVYVVMTITDNPSDTSLNMQGPILINTKTNLGKQLVLVNSNYEVRHRLINELEEEYSFEKAESGVPVGA